MQAIINRAIIIKVLKGVIMANTKLTRKMIEKARRLSAEFKTDKEIYTALGISETAFYDYKAGRKGGKLSAAFAAALKKGREEYLDNLEAEAVAGIRSAGAHSWQAYAWLLERTKPDQYGKVDRLQATLDGSLNNEITIEITGGE